MFLTSGIVVSAFGELFYVGLLNYNHYVLFTRLKVKK